jgi:hypothetical protein
MKKLILSVLLALILFASPRYLAAAPMELVTTPLSEGFGGDFLEEFGNAALLKIGFPPTIHLLLPIALFSNRIFTPEDVGHTFVADRQTDAFFDFITNSFTSGSADLLTVCIEPVPSSGFSGASACIGFPRSGFPATDLRGLEIDRWFLTLNSLNISLREFPPQPFGPSGLFTFIDASVTVAVNVIPEPRTGLMLLVGVTSIFLRRRCFRC